jgi:hypothetical protein
MGDSKDSLAVVQPADDDKPHFLRGMKKLLRLWWRSRPLGSTRSHFLVARCGGARSQTVARDPAEALR